MMNFSGYSNDKPSSRVLNPPGGRSNNIFGSYDEKPSAAQEALSNKTNQTHATNIFGDVQPAGAQANAYTKPNNARTASNIFGCDDQRQTTNNNTNNKSRRGFNTITGVAYDDEPKQQPQQSAPQQVAQAAEVQPEQKQHVPEHVLASQQAANNLHTSSRVLQPPGGKTTKLW